MYLQTSVHYVSFKFLKNPGIPFRLESCCSSFRIQQDQSNLVLKFYRRWFKATLRWHLCAKGELANNLALSFIIYGESQPGSDIRQIICQHFPETLLHLLKDVEMAHISHNLDLQFLLNLLKNVCLVLQNVFFLWIGVGRSLTSLKKW